MTAQDITALEMGAKLAVDKALPKILGIDSYIPPDFSIYETAKTTCSIAKASYPLVKTKYRQMTSRKVSDSEKDAEQKSTQSPQTEIESKPEPTPGHESESKSELESRQEPEPIDPPKEEVIENLRNTEKEYIKTSKELEQAQAEYTPRKQEATEQIREAERLESRLEDIDNLKGPQSREQALERFEREYDIKPQDAPAKIKELREQSSKTTQELKPMEDKIQSLKDTQAQDIKKYDKQMADVSKRPDKQEITDKLGQLREAYGVKPRDIRELQKIEQNNLKGHELARTH